MRAFSGVEGWIRRHFFVYRFVRSAAPFVCRFLTLEEGFQVLNFIKPLDANFVAIDVGANDGTSIRMIRQFQRNVPIVAFDPITRPKFNLKNIDFREFALSDEETHLSLYTPVVRGTTLTQYSSFHSEKLRRQIQHDLGVDRTEYGIIEKTIETRTLDSLKLSPFFIKIDVEGAEVSVIEGAKETILKYRPIVLVEIQNLETYKLIENIMISLNYVSISLKQKKNISKSKIEQNYEYVYLISQNNYVWIPKNISISWKFII